MNYIVIAAVIVGMFAAERLVIAALVRQPRSREWLRGARLFHPNAISVVRIPMGLAAIALWHFGWPETAIYWFAFWMITDITDGTIARHCDLVTATGEWLDPLSDKLLYFPALLFFAWGEPSTLTLPWIIALVGIDTLGQFSRLLVRKRAANVFGKSKTALITVLLVLTAFRELALLQRVDNLFTAGVFLDFLGYLTVCCLLLAFLSVFCKVVPDNWYANFLSLANFGCGALAIFYVIEGRMLIALILVFIGQFFDLFDGRLARKYGSTRHGPIFDDIADGTSFGLAIAFIVYVQFGQSYLALFVAMAYFLAVVYRLVRYLRHKGQLPPGVFEGLPSPAGALLAGSTALLFPASPWFGPILVLAGAILMVSRLSYWHFGQKMWIETPNIFKVTICLLVLLFVSRALADQDYRMAFKISLFILAVLYLVVGAEKVASRLSGQGGR